MAYDFFDLCLIVNVVFAREWVSFPCVPTQEGFPDTVIQAQLKLASVPCADTAFAMSAGRRKIQLSSEMLSMSNFD